MAVLAFDDWGGSGVASKVCGGQTDGQTHDSIYRAIIALRGKIGKFWTRGKPMFAYAVQSATDCESAADLSARIIESVVSVLSDAELHAETSATTQ